MSSETRNNQLSVKFPDELGDKIREIAENEARSINNTIKYLVKLGIDQFEKAS